MMKLSESCPNQIFNRIVDVLPVNQRSQKYPGWVEAFRRQCHPCTDITAFKCK